MKGWGTLTLRRKSQSETIQGNQGEWQRGRSYWYPIYVPVRCGTWLLRGMKHGFLIDWSSPNLKRAIATCCANASVRRQRVGGGLWGRTHNLKVQVEQIPNRLHFRKPPAGVSSPELHDVLWADQEPHSDTVRWTYRQGQAWRRQRVGWGVNY